MTALIYFGDRFVKMRNRWIIVVLCLILACIEINATADAVLLNQTRDITEDDGYINGMKS